MVAETLEKATILTGAVAREMEVAKRLKEHYDGKVPVVATVFTPLIRVVLVVSQTVYRYNET